MKPMTFWVLVAIGLLFAAFAFWGCSDEDNPAAPAGEANTADCIGCHTNETMLKAVALPDTGSSGDDSGEG
ncbi:MAG: hypothetical protein ACOZB3_03850 [Calditrichota bacterium]